MSLMPGGWGSGQMAKAIAPAPQQNSLYNFGHVPFTQHTPTPAPSAGQQAIDYFTGIYGPDLAINNQQSGNLAGQLGQAEAGFNMSQSALLAGSAADMAKLNLGPEYDALERQAIYRQMVGLNSQDNLAYQLLGSQFKGFDLQTKQAWEDTAQKQQQLRSDATARGAMSAPGIHRNMKDTATDLANQVGGIETNREQAVIGAKQGQLGRDEQKAQLNDRNKQLDIKAKEYGIDRAKLSANLSQGLARLGIDQMVTVNQILDALNSNDLQRMGIAHQIFNDAMGYSDFFTTNNPAGGGSGTAPAPNPVRDRAVDEFIGR